MMERLDKGIILILILRRKAHISGRILEAQGAYFEVHLLGRKAHRRKYGQ